MDIVHVSSAQEFDQYVEALSDLTEDAFPKRISVDFLRWVYVSNPCSANLYLALAITDNGVVAGNYSVSPRLLRRRREDVQASLSMTTMTHSEHRGQGIFPLLASSLYARLKGDDRNLVYGFPNSQSHHSFIRKLDWCPVTDVATFSTSLSSSPRSDATSFVVADTLPPTIELNQAVTIENCWTIVRDQAYLRWRYEEHPTNDYHFVLPRGELNSVENFAVYKHFGSSSIDIVEFHARNDEQALEMIQTIAAVTVDLGVITANIWIPPGHPRRGCLERCGFTASAPVHYFGFRHSDPESYSMFSNAREWDIQMGDSDVF